MYRVFAVLSLVVAGILTPAVAGQNAVHAAGGNSDAAHLCQQGGYLMLVGTNGSSDTGFGNTGQCVSYAAHGGWLVDRSSAEPCLNGGYAGLTTEGGSMPFPSEAACVLYVAEGGTPVPVSTASILVTYSGIQQSGDQYSYFTFTVATVGLQVGSPVYVLAENIGEPIAIGTVQEGGAVAILPSFGGVTCGQGNETFTGTKTDGTPVSVAYTPPC